MPLRENAVAVSSLLQINLFVNTWSRRVTKIEACCRINDDAGGFQK